MIINNVLAVVAHPDDLEMMGGGTMINFIDRNIKIHVLTLTDGSWHSPDGIIVRSKNEAVSELDKVCKFMKYSSSEQLMEKTLDLQYNDYLVSKVINHIEQFNIDTVITTWSKDSHRDHRIACEISSAASRRVPNFLMGQVNYFMNDFFNPNIFVDITESWDRKIEALSLYESQWRKDWYEFLDATSKYYGKIIGVKRAEGFISAKLKI